VNTLDVVQLNFADFDKMEKQWADCLKGSEANPLFSSWIWQKSWWDVWQPRLDLELFLLGVYEDGKLLGIAPCYTYNVKRVSLFTVKRCEFIGNYSHNDDSIRSEYLSFILPNDRYEEILALIMAHIHAHHIDELVLTDVDANSNTAKYIEKNYSSCDKTEEQGICIRTTEQFSSYLSSLGKNTRLKLFNRRKTLKNQEVIVLKEPEEINVFFENLNAMHQSRWGRVCFSPHSENFHQKISEYFLKENNLELLILLKDNIPLAVCYDIKVENTQYNIQLGFSSFANNKVSLGTLMLGYAIEKAHESPSIEYYDLLAGSGKNTFYKTQFRGESRVFSTFFIPLTYKVKYLLKLKVFLRKLKGVFSKK
jgi:hypothetical protein